MEELRVGIIGAGGIAQERHIPALIALRKKVVITAVCDVNEAKAKEAAARFEIPHFFKEYEEMLSTMAIDAVVICTPNKFHAAITIAALKAGAHVLCEKPMAMTTAECRRMANAAKNADKLLSIGYHYRHTDAARMAKEAMQAQQIGDPLVTRIQAMRRRKVPGWGVFTNKELQGGGSLIDYGCHFIDLAFWLLHYPEPVEVMGRAYNRLSTTPNQVNEWGAFDYQTFNVDDHVSSYITFKDGSSLQFECSWAANIKEDQMHLSVSGAEGGLNVYPFEIYRPQDNMYQLSEGEADQYHNETEAGNRQIRNFVNSCLGRESLLVEPEEALQVNQIIEAIYQSNEQARSVRLNESE
ncbi:MAG TPA: Gfo/Idh/MocA family oxidoreductase [Pseudogracilibacillus sp.]|nr:Gfo/Idh/MocA family oxidoreductase [Pseudogracilibacillus sp.]